MLRLPRHLRSELKAPIGPVYTEPSALIEAAGTPLVSVGDVVTEYLLSVTIPHVAVVDGQTKRTSIDSPVDLSPFEQRVRVENPAATLSEAMLQSLRDALNADDSTVIVVDGEEDLVALPAVVAAPIGASIVYGQPDEGMVLATVDAELTAQMRALLSRMDGDHEAALRIVESGGQ
ncbi:GTP-dependent dephospho-CoA kinase family protein [Halocatena marina]|uniref:GTP-dependent dephospho-CoA kinase n=1 Tax=Halocatena marina TaxID=2934937 RepID=A0ABD5YH56_9EURY|nr:GTP-dependent dephospho-CoA kinase family protein [Halocatena marina]